MDHGPLSLAGSVNMDLDLAHPFGFTFMVFFIELLTVKPGLHTSIGNSRIMEVDVFITVWADKIITGEF